MLTIFKNQPLCLCYQRFAFTSVAYLRGTEFCIEDIPYGSGSQPMRRGTPVRREMSSGVPQKILKLKSIKYALKNSTPRTLVNTAH